MRGAAQDASVLQFALVAGRAATASLGADDWELTPQTAFPIELIAAPVFRSEANALAIGPKIVMIELGSDGQFMQKLSTAAAIEIKTAQTTLRLPLEGFGSALSEVDTCFGALGGRMPIRSPRRRPRPSNRPCRRPISRRPAPRRRPSPRSTPFEALRPRHRAPASGSRRAHRGAHVPHGRGRQRALPPGSAGGAACEGERPLPVALITHGKNSSGRTTGIRADMMLPQARDLAARGWLAVAVIRRGYGQSDGIPGVARRRLHGVRDDDLVRGFDLEAEDLDAALKALALRPDADGSRAIAVGQSLGGGAVLALAARRPAGLLAVVNVSGGVWRSTGRQRVRQRPLVAAMAASALARPFPRCGSTRRTTACFLPSSSPACTAPMCRPAGARTSHGPADRA